MFRSFVLFIAAHFQAVTFSHIFKFLNFEFLRYFFHRFLHLTPVTQSFVIIIFLLVISYFPYFIFVTFKTRVILWHPEEGRPCLPKCWKNISLYCVISLANFRLLFNLLLIRSSTARGSGTSILLRWSLQKLTSTALYYLFTLQLWLFRKLEMQLNVG